MEKTKSTLEVEKRTPLSHGSLRRQVHHPLRPPVMSSRLTSLTISSSLSTSVKNQMNQELHTPLSLNKMINSDSSTTLMPLAPPNTEPQELLFSDNSRKPKLLTQVITMLMPLLLGPPH